MAPSCVRRVRSQQLSVSLYRLLVSLQREMQELHRENMAIVAEAQMLGYEVLDTFQITQGRYRDFLPGHCACHFHKVKGPLP